MPGFDGTGPYGEGNMTGRGRGYCLVPLDELNKEDPSLRRFLWGRGYRSRRGFSRGVVLRQHLRSLSDHDTGSSAVKNDEES